MRRDLTSALAVATLVASVLLASCTQGIGGAFSEPTPGSTPHAPAHLDLTALAGLRDQLVGALAAHTKAGHLDLSWGAGGTFALAGPYPNTAAVVDAGDLLAAQTLPAGSGGPSAPRLQTMTAALAATTTAGYRNLNGPNGAAYLVLARLAAANATVTCPSPGPGDDPTCLRAGFSDALKTGWYAGDSKTFFHVGEPTTVYRPVDAIGVAAALVVAGFNEHNDDKISAGSDIIGKEMSSDFDQHFGLVYGLMSATSQGGRMPIDTSTRIADQAGIAEMLLEAFDAAREQQYLNDARQVLQPLLDDRVGLRTANGYLSGFDLRSNGPDAGGPVDVEATLLTMQAARHYDRDDGGRFAGLEELAAQSTLTGAARADAGQGLPGSLQGAAATLRSGLVTALAVVALNDVLANPPGASSSPPSAPVAPSGETP